MLVQVTFMLHATLKAPFPSSRTSVTLTQTWKYSQAVSMLSADAMRTTQCHRVHQAYMVLVYKMLDLEQ